jgi:hypothetical protein
MKYAVIFEIPGREPITKKHFRNKADAEEYALDVSEHCRAKTWKILVKEVKVNRTEESQKYSRDRSLYDTLCNGDPSFKDRISFEDFQDGGLARLEKEERIREKNAKNGVVHVRDLRPQ